MLALQNILQQVQTDISVDWLWWSRFFVVCDDWLMGWVNVKILPGIAGTQLSLSYWIPSLAVGKLETTFWWRFLVIGSVYGSLAMFLPNIKRHWRKAVKVEIAFDFQFSCLKLLSKGNRKWLAETKKAICLACQRVWPDRVIILACCGAGLHRAVLLPKDEVELEFTVFVYLFTLCWKMNSVNVLIGHKSSFSILFRMLWMYLWNFLQCHNILMKVLWCYATSSTLEIVCCTFFYCQWPACLFTELKTCNKMEVIDLSHHSGTALLASCFTPTRSPK